MAVQQGTKLMSEHDRRESRTGYRGFQEGNLAMVVMPAFSESTNRTPAVCVQLVRVPGIRSERKLLGLEPFPFFTALLKSPLVSLLRVRPESRLFTFWLFLFAIFPACLSEALRRLASVSWHTGECLSFQLSRRPLVRV